jgi:two-component system response regulator YesN
MNRVLVVDDNRLERKLITHILQTKATDNIKIDEVGDGSAALDYLLNLKYNLVITDLIMPGLDGIELIGKIKKQYKQCKIIAISGRNPFYLYIAKKLGVDYIYTKPLDIDNFVSAVNRLLIASKSENSVLLSEV